MKGSRNNRMRNRLLYSIRACKKYDEWKKAILKSSFPQYPLVPKTVQVHHLKKVMNILKENNIETLDEALNCQELWSLSNGTVLLKGEHMIISALERHKWVSVGFLTFLKEWITENEGKTSHIKDMKMKMKLHK